MKRRLHPTLLVALLVLALGLLTSCGSDQSDPTSTSAGDETTTALSETTSTTVGATSTSLATTTTASSTTTTEVDVIEIEVEGGQVVSGPERIEAELGSTVMFFVVADTVDHVHVHGYDVFFDVAPGSPAEIHFTANVPGIFEIELEGSHVLIAELEVS